MREVIRQVQSARKQADLNIDDRITLVLHASSPELQKAIDDHKDIIKTETLAMHLSVAQEPKSDTSKPVRVAGAELFITLSQA